MTRLLLLFLILGWAIQVKANVVELANHSEHYSLGASMQWAWESRELTDLEQVFNGDQLEWVSSQGNVPNLGFSHDGVWFRAKIYNQNSQHHWFLVVDYPLIRNLQVYYIRNGVAAEMFHSGDQFEFSARPINHRNFIFPLDLNSGEQIDVYLRVKGPYSIQMPLHLVSNTVLVEKDVVANLLHGLFFGFVLVMAFYNFFLFVSTREPAYFFYVLFTVAIGSFQFVQQGYAYQFFWPKEVWLQNKATGAFIHISLIFCVFFVNNFLDMRRNFVALYRAISALGLLSLLVLLSSPWVDEFWVMRLGVIFSLPGAVMAILGGWYVWRLGREDARLFSFAWVFFLVGVLSLSLNKLGVIPRNFVTEHGAEVGTVIELALLAFALAGRINHERNRRLELEKHSRELEQKALASKEHALELEKMNSEQLELSVRERTRDLHKALSELSLMNRRLEQLNLIDSVTSVGNENCFVVTSKKEWDRAFRRSEILSLIVVELDGYREILASYGEVVADECLKNVANILEKLISRPSDCITRYGDKVFGVILPATEEEGALFLANQIVSNVNERPFDFGAAKISASVSVGVASVSPQKPNNYKELIELAESAVYISSSSGGNCVQCASVKEIATE